MELLFLGTGSSIPTKERNHSAILLEYDGHRLLFDCGEGTQRQFVVAGKSFMKIEKIFISHWHADHFMGLPTLLHSMSLNGRGAALEVYGPEAKRHLKALLKAGYGRLAFRIKAFDVPFKGAKITSVCMEEDYDIFSVPSKHSAPSVAYSLVGKDAWNIDTEKLAKLGIKEGPHLKSLKEKGSMKDGKKKILLKDVATLKRGRKVVYTGDTKYSANIVKLSKNADVLIHDSTFLEKEKYDHASAKDAALVAKKAKAKMLILTHFSSRYVSSAEHLKEAGKVFPSVIAAKDFLVYGL